MKKMIGLTGPSTFTQHCIEVIEEFLEANFVLLYHGADDNLNYWLDRVDGIILAGGVDIHPTVYGESVWTNCNLSKFDIKRDCRELQVIDRCLKSSIPMLGICRGHQLLGIRHGLSFMMDISNAPICHQPQKHGIQSDNKEPMHAVKIIAPSIVYDLFGMPQEVPERKVFQSMTMEKQKNKIWVNSFHHQAIPVQKVNYQAMGIDVLGLGRLDMQACKENIELMQGKNWLSCQWHPEYDWEENTASRVVLQRFKTMVG